MEQKKKAQIIEGVLAGVVGFGFYWYLLIHQNIKIVDPNFLFFATLLGLLIASLFLNKGYFYFFFALTAIICWIYEATLIAERVMEKIAMF